MREHVESRVISDIAVRSFLDLELGVPVMRILGDML